MAHSQNSPEDWRDKFARIFKPAPPLASIYDIEDFADDYQASINACMTPNELWRSVFYHTVKRELEAGDTRGRRYLHVDYLGLDVIAVYEYPSARTNEEELTAEVAFGAVSALSTEQLQKRLKAKLFYVPSYACTSFAVSAVFLSPSFRSAFVFRAYDFDRSGIFMHNLFRSSKVTTPSLRKAPVANVHPFSLTVDPAYRYMVFFRPCASTPDVSLPLSTRDSRSSESSEPVVLGQLNILQTFSGQATAQLCSSPAAPVADACTTATPLVPQRSVGLSNLPSRADVGAQDEACCAQEEQSKTTLEDATACEQKSLDASVPDLGQLDDDDDDMDRSHDTSLSSVDSFGPSTPSSRDTFSRFSVISTGRRSLYDFHSIFSGISGSPPPTLLPRSDFRQSLDFLCYMDRRLGLARNPRCCLSTSRTRREGPDKCL